MLLACVACVACAAPDRSADRVLLVSTHSIEDSGLLEVLAAAIQRDHPSIRVVTTAVGSGAALEIGRRGDADILITHDPDGERAFMAAGHGTEQGLVMSNAYLLVGPPSDPAGIGGMGDVVAALRALAGTGGRFLSRGDDSGTHRKERSLWREVGMEPWAGRPGWYIEAGLGMAEALQTASEMGAYVLTDEATFLVVAPRLRLEPLVRDDPWLANPYSYTVPRRQRNPEAARVLADWLVGPGQEAIAGFGVERLGRPLFHPAAQPPGPGVD